MSLPKIRLTQAPPPGVPRVHAFAEGAMLPPRYAAAAAAAGFIGAAGQAALCRSPRGRPRLLVGLGAHADVGACEAAGALAVARLPGVPRLAIDARGLAPGAAAACATGAALRAWRHDRHRAEDDPPRLDRIDLVADAGGIEAAWAEMEAVLRGTALARALVAEPANLLTPAGFVARLRRLRKEGLTLEVLRGDRLRQAGFGGLLAVGRAAAHEPQLAVLRWPGRQAGAPVALIGKGITFDTGGLSIKPAEGMWEMRADMAGAAACAGALLALARRRSPVPAVAVLALAENAVGADAYRPGDVLRLADGATVEVVDTDAEGRLVLADALAWTRRQLRPRAMIDVATLTGSIVTALGHHMAGLFGSDPALLAHIAAAGAASGEPVWRMPIGARHRDDLASSIADLRQCASGRLQPDACHAAAFLREFAGDVPWAHLDIAGVEAWPEADDRRARGATGWGVRLLDALVRLRYEDAGA